MFPANLHSIHPNTQKKLDGLKTALEFGENKYMYWQGLPEINKKYLANKFKVSKLPENGKEAAPLLVTRPWILFQALNKMPEPYCLVEVAHQLKLIGSSEKADLLKELFGTDEELQIPKIKRSCRNEKPFLNYDDGIVYLNGKPVLKTQVRESKTIIQEILQAFQDQNWQETIRDPFGGIIKSDRRFIIGYLNRLVKTKCISFSRSRDRKFLEWNLNNPKLNAK